MIRLRLPVLWGDMDALGHVNNARYFTWFESARIALFEELGLGAAGRPELGAILARATCDFHVPLHYPDEIEVTATVSRIGRTSFTMDYAITRVADPERTVARGEGIVVLYDYSEQRKVEIPPELRAGLERHLAR